MRKTVRSKEIRTQWQTLCQMDPNRVIDVPRAIDAARRAQQFGDMGLSLRWANRAEQIAARLGGPVQAEVELKRAQMARAAGRIMMCRHHIVRALQADPTNVICRDRGADIFQSFGDLNGAVACLFDTLDTTTEIASHPTLLLRHASIAAAQGKTAAASTIAQRIATNDQSSAALLVSTGNVFLSISEFEAGKRCFARAIERDGQYVDAYIAMAFLSLHRGQTQKALLHATRATGIAPNHPRARLVRATARLFLGEKPETLIKEFDSVVQEMPSNAEALSLRAQARRNAGDARGALKDLLLAKHSGNEAQNVLFDLELVALGRQFWGLLSIEELTAMARAPQGASLHGRVHWRTAQQALGHIEKVASKAVWLLPESALRPFAERFPSSSQRMDGEVAMPRSLRLRLLALLCPDELLRVTHGNRSTNVTYFDPGIGRLKPLEIRHSARYRAKTAQWEILHSPPDEVLRSFDAVVRDNPFSHHPNAYRGEVLLWLGRYDEAAADFREGLQKNPRARWLYIGIGAVFFFQGNTSSAIVSFQRSVDVAPLFVGPTLYAYRGEAFRLAGRTSEAVHDLEIACRDNPSRISAWVNLWLAKDDLGDVTERDAVMDELWSRARYLLADAADECFSCPFLKVESAADQRRLLEHTLRMMRGNRSSSCVTYFTKTSELRTVIC
jgi:tetratricopeptide (TPR) repeat protein